MPHRPRSLNYRSFLLRVWRDDTRKPWRVSLQTVHDEQLHHFTNLEAMYAHLLAQMSDVVEPANEGNRLDTDAK